MSSSSDSIREPGHQRHGRTVISWSVVLGIAGMHLGAIAALFFFSWSALAAMVFFAWLTGNIGITLAYHRLLTHRSFKTPKWFEYVVTLCGCLAWQGGPIQWVGNHRIHHRHSDTDGDPHTPKHGFTWSHMLWCMFQDPPNQRGVDAAMDLRRDPVHRLMDRYFFVPQFLLMAVLFGVGHWLSTLGWQTSGLSWVLWGVCARVVMVYHVTWFINSATHTWGYRNYKTKDRSTNLWWLGLFAFGEGWHNNHHAHQRSAAHGLRWFEFDLTFITIKALSLVGLARDIVLPDPDKMPQAEAARAKREAEMAADGALPSKPASQAL